jgi:hypothetical protein
MTVCIGAICEQGKAVVVAADRMMTFGPPMNLQAEGAVRKIGGNFVPGAGHADLKSQVSVRLKSFTFN